MDIEKLGLNMFSFIKKERINAYIYVLKLKNLIAWVFLNLGPPPVSKEIIDALPVVEVTNEQIAAKLQCSVCWEDFVAKENVRQLPCQHIYHEPCIRPWLELHGTCPICRQHLSMDGNSDGNQASGVSNTGSRHTTFKIQHKKSY